MLTCLKDYFDYCGGPCNFIYKLTLRDGVLSVYNITPKETQNENEVLLTHDLIYTCECTKEEWDDTKSKPLLNVRDAIENHATSLFVASDYFDSGFACMFNDDVYVNYLLGEYSYGDYECGNDRYLVRYVRVNPSQDW